MHQLALFAGSAAAAIFIVSQLPMLIKARRTKNLTSYSFANIGLANVGNALYAVYVFQVPIGPVWATHGFNVTTSGLMLFWYLRYGRRPRLAEGGRNELHVLSSVGSGRVGSGSVGSGSVGQRDQDRRKTRIKARSASTQPTNSKL